MSRISGLDSWVLNMHINDLDSWNSSSWGTFSSCFTNSVSCSYLSDSLFQVTISPLLSPQIPTPPSSLSGNDLASCFSEETEVAWRGLSKTLRSYVLMYWHLHTFPGITVNETSLLLSKGNLYIFAPDPILLFLTQGSSSIKEINCSRHSPLFPL